MSLPVVADAMVPVPSTTAGGQHLAVEALAKHFTLHLLGGRRVEALHPITFSAEAGEFVAVFGASGSGKSTLLKCLNRTYLPSSGWIAYRTADGGEIDLASADDEAIVALRGAQREIGYVSQFLRPTPRVTAEDLVAAPLLAVGVERHDARAQAAALLRRLGLPDDLRDDFPVLFSGGEQQRVNIARALIALPRLLLLDEPTSALDAGNQETVVDLLREAKAAGTTILGIFHDRALVRRIGDRVLVLDDGRLVAARPAGTVLDATR